MRTKSPRKAKSPRKETKRSAPVKVRRTQAERRAETIRRLVDATLDSLLAVGYARTTVKEICRRADLSHGALFRFFPTVLDLVLAAAEEVAKRQIGEFEARFDSPAVSPQAIGAALALLRDVCRSPTNMIFHELLNAARTDRDLHRVLEPGIRRYFAAIRDSARRVPGVEALPGELVDVLLFAAIHLFDGEAMVRGVYPQPAIEDQRLALLNIGIAKALGLGETPSE